jgi:hypothetical protein
MKTLRKTMLNAAFSVGLLALAGVIAAACAGPLDPQRENDDGKGYVRISIAPDASARTVLPNALQLYYTLSFNNGTVTTTETLGGALQKTVALPPGTYTLAALGYRSPYEAENAGAPVVNGSPASSFTVSAGVNPDVDVILTATQTGTGTLRYTLTYPTNPAVSGGRIYVEQLGGPYKQLIIPTILSSSSSTSTSTGTIPDLPSGYYQVTVYLSNGRPAIASDLAHIYDNLETDAQFVFTASSFADVADLSSLTYAINKAKEAASQDLRISPDGTGITAGHTWVAQTDLDALNAALAVAETIVANYGAGLTDTAANAAATALNTALAAFTAACAAGTYTPGAYVLYVGAETIPRTDAGRTLASALAWLQTNAASNTEYTVLLGDDESLPPWTLGGSAGTNVALNGLTGVTLTLKGDTAERVIQLSGSGSLFRVNNSGVTLVLDQNITLRGHSANNAPLVFVANGSLKMYAGAKITGNTSSSSSYGGGVYVSGGTFTMSGGEISGNTSSYGGGVYVDGGTFALKDDGKVAVNNPVYLAGTADAITIDGALSGTDPVACIQLPVDPAWLGKTAIKKSASFTGALQEGRFAFTGPWEMDSDGRVFAKASSLGFGETRSAFINRGEVHLYRFRPTFNKTYTITNSAAGYDSATRGYRVYASAVWADGSGVLVNHYNESTTPSFVATKTGVDIIIMMDSDTYIGVYSVKYNELD